MTDEERVRFFTGRWPWKHPGFVVTGTGVVPNVPDTGRPWVTREERKQIRDTIQKEKESARKQFQELSPEELQPRIKIARDVMGEQWVQVRKKGKKAVERYKSFKNWIGQALRHDLPVRDWEEESPSTGMPIQPDVWDDWVAGKSHLHTMRQVGGLPSRIQMLNRVAARLEVLRTLRFRLVFGNSSRKVPDETKRFAATASEVMRQNGQMWQSGLTKTVGEKEDVSRRTVERWLIEKNPLHKQEAESRQEKFEELRVAIEKVNKWS